MKKLPLLLWIVALVVPLGFCALALWIGCCCSLNVPREGGTK